MNSRLPPVVASDRGPGLYVEAGVVIPDDAEIAPHVTIYAGVELGAGVVLGQGAILGRPQQRDPRSRSPRAATGTTRVGDGCQIGNGALLEAGTTMLAGSRVTDFAVVAVGAVMEEDSVLGRGSGLGHFARVGPRTRIMNQVLIAAWSRIGADVLISPRVTLVGDATMGRRLHAEQTPAVVLGRACRIGTGAILVPPVEVGEEAVVAAASLVTRDVAARTVVAGAPARMARAVREDELLEAWGQSI
jgi:acetyltransferase-like isoleucine patch superfamily enzyme